MFYLFHKYESLTLILKLTVWFLIREEWRVSKYISCDAIVYIKYFLINSYLFICDIFSESIYYGTVIENFNRRLFVFIVCPVHIIYYIFLSFSYTYESLIWTSKPNFQFCEKQLGATKTPFLARAKFYEK